MYSRKYLDYVEEQNKLPKEERDFPNGMTSTQSQFAEFLFVNDKIVAQKKNNSS